jgi:hypothetical protein
MNPVDACLERMITNHLSFDPDKLRQTSHKYRIVSGPSMADINRSLCFPDEPGTIKPSITFSVETPRGPAELMLGVIGHQRHSSVAAYGLVTAFFTLSDSSPEIWKYLIDPDLNFAKQCYCQFTVYANYRKPTDDEEGEGTLYIPY